MVVVEWLIMVSLPFAFTECFYIYIHIRCEERRQNRPRKTLNSKTHFVRTSKDRRNCPHYKDVGIQKVWMGAGGEGGASVLLVTVLLSKKSITCIYRDSFA